MCDCEPAEFYHQAQPVARKAHRCDECGAAINVGDRYQRFSGKWDGHFDSFRLCLGCVEVFDEVRADSGCCVGIGELREMLAEYPDGSLTPAMVAFMARREAP